MRFGETTRQVRVSKADLIEKVKANRDEHRAVFEKAQEKYREAVIAELDKRLTAAKQGRKILLHFNLPEPVDYTEQYDEALAQLDWEVEDTVELDQTEFNRLVLNKWEWSGLFAANTESYVGGVR